MVPRLLNTCDTVKLHLHRLISMFDDRQSLNVKNNVNNTNFTIFNGSLGCAFACLHIAEAVSRSYLHTKEEHLLEWNHELLELCGTYIQSISERVKRSPIDRQKHCLSVLNGSDIGQALITAWLHSKMLRQQPQENKELRQELKQSVEASVHLIVQRKEDILSVALTSSENQNLFEGCAGWLWGLLFLRRTVPESIKIIPLELLEKVALHLVACGRLYSHAGAAAAKESSSSKRTSGGSSSSGSSGGSGSLDSSYIMRLPLMFESNGLKLLGAGKGLIGIIFVLLLVVEEMNLVAKDAFNHVIHEMTVSISLSVEYLIQSRTLNGNIKKRPEIDSNDDMGWCHGAVGLGLLFCKCSTVLGSTFEPLRLSSYSTIEKERFQTRERFIFEADRCKKFLAYTFVFILLIDF